MPKQIDRRSITIQAFSLCVLGAVLIFLMTIYALSQGHDGLAVVAASTAIAGMVAGVSGFTIGRVITNQN